MDTTLDTVRDDVTRQMVTAKARGADTMVQGAGLFFGSATMGSEEGAILLSRAPNESGTLYTPPGLVALCSFTTASGNRVDWKSSDSFGWHLEFGGELGSNGMLGVLRGIRRGTEVFSDSVILESIASETARDRRTGVYSDVEYHEEAGDLLGTEVILLHEPGAVHGSITFHEGGAGTPYALLSPQVTGDTVRAEVATNYGQGAVLLVHRGDSVSFQISGADLDFGAVLPRKATIEEFLKEESHRDCS